MKYLNNFHRMQDQETIAAKQRLRDELAEISYVELERFFAKGVILEVHKDVDLLETALVIHHDVLHEVEKLITKGCIQRAHDEHAKKWLLNNTRFHAVTVAPWVLVQEI